MKKCNVWATKIQRNFAVKNDLLSQKWCKEVGEQVVESKVDKSSVYNVLAEGMYLLDKNGSWNFNLLYFPLLVWSCPNFLCDFCNQESASV